ncbi:MAG: GNAT family N-acetyltransferase [Bacillota bacterium]|nr:GNAT family N-acetyltransferase [Bacillota bacterium]
MRQIRAEQVLPLRSLVLRDGKPLDECVFDGDSLKTTLHLGGFIDGSLVSVGTFLINPHEGFQGKNQHQLRGLATLPEYRGRNFGTLLIKRAEEILTLREAELWWCNARVSAVGFYKKLGLIVYGDEFIIEGVGPHRVMYRVL